MYFRTPIFFRKQVCSGKVYISQLLPILIHCFICMWSYQTIICFQILIPVLTFAPQTICKSTLRTIDLTGSQWGVLVQNFDSCIDICSSDNMRKHFKGYWLDRQSVRSVGGSRGESGRGLAFSLINRTTWHRPTFSLLACYLSVYSWILYFLWIQYLLHLNFILPLLLFHSSLQLFHCLRASPTPSSRSSNSSKVRRSSPLQTPIHTLSNLPP